MKKIYLVCLVAAYILSGCQGNSAHSHDDHAHDHSVESSGHNHEHEHEHEEHEHEHEAGEIVFKKDKAEAIGLQTEVMTPSVFAEVLKTSGQVQEAQGSESVLVATIPGIVSLGSTRLMDGTAVRKGQTVLSLASRSLSDGDVVLRLKNTYETALHEYERMKDLVADKIVSKKDFEQARLAYENAKVAYDAVVDKQSAKGVAVTATMNGFLKNVLVKEGDYVAVGQPLATISQNNRLVLRADVSEKYYSRLPMLRSANFKTPYDDKLYKLDDLNGRFLQYGKASSDNSFYVPVLFEFDNKGAVIPGSFVEVYLLGTPIEQVLSVPLTSLIEEQGVYSVYIRLDENCYKKQEVTLGVENGERIQILSGLKAGDKVVTKGAYQIKLSSASNAIPAHSHHH